MKGQKDMTIVNDITEVAGGVCAPQGFTAAGTYCGIRRNKNKKDLALIYCSVPCNTSALYTSNVVKAAPLIVTKMHLKDGIAQAVIANSGNANSCALNGKENALRMARAAALQLNLKTEDIVVASTGVIGVPLEIDVIEQGMAELAGWLSPTGSSDAAEAIMTTDTFPKEYAVSFSIGRKAVYIGGISKGSGMIHPNMGTTLSFLTTDADIEPSLLEKAFTSCVKRSFNRISVDGDTSTNDMAVIMASGLAGNERIKEEGEDYNHFVAALMKVCVHLAKELARDGEGSTRLISCTIYNAASEEKAEQMAKAVISSSLTKAAVFGKDANWGRVLCAMGYSGAEFDHRKTDIFFRSGAGTVQVCKGGKGLNFDEDLARLILSEEEIEILGNLNEGMQEATAWGCDLTYDYVRINGNYRT